MSADPTRSVRGLLRARAAGSGSRAFLESARDDRVVRWSAMESAADAWTRRLDAAEVPAGGRVSLRVADPLRFAAAFLGILAAGRVVAPVEPEPSPVVLRRHLRTVDPAAVVVTETSGELRGEPAAAVADLAEDLGGSWARLEVRAAAAPRLAGAGLVLASSGTTGPPKLVELTEAQLLHTASSIASHHGFTEHDRGFNPLTLFHINAEVVGILSTLVAGSQLVLDDRFHRTGFWKLLAEREVTWLNGVPAILAILAQERPEPLPPASLRFARSASAPLPVRVLQSFEQATGIGVVETYGMTEAGSQITANPVDGGRRPGSVGLPVGVDLQVVDTDDVAVPAETVGRVRIRGEGVITRYAGDAGNEQVGADGWLDTGDLGRLDPEGFLHLAGRADDIINRGGEKFFPADVEEVLLTDPDVAAAVVVGWPDDVLGAIPVAAIVLRPGLDDDAAAAAVPKRLRSLAVARLDKPRRPARFHVVPGIPTGVNGKVSRRAVREDLQSRLGESPIGRDEIA